MNRKEFLSVRSIFPDDTINELRRARAADPPFDEDIQFFKKLVEEDARMDKSYKKLLLCLIYMDQNVETEKELKDEDDEDCDPEPRRSQVMNEVDEVENVRGSLDMVLDSHEVCDPKLGKTVSKGKQKVGDSSQMPDVENCSTQSRTKLVNEVEVEIENGSLDMGLVTNKESDPKLGKKGNRTGKQKVSHSSQRSVKNYSTQSRTELANEVEVEIEKGSPDMGLVKKANRTGNQKEGHSNQMLDVENCSTQSPTKLANEVGVDIKEGSPDTGLVSCKDCDPKLGKKVNGSGKQKVGHSSQMLDVENCSTQSCTKLANEVEVEIKKGSADMGLVSHKECAAKLGKKVSRTGKQKEGHSNQMPDVQNCSTQSPSKLANEVEVEIEEGLLVMGLVSHMECDPKLGKKVNGTGKQKVGHSSQMPDVENCSTQVPDIEKGSPDMVMDSHKERDPQIGKRGNRTRRQKVGHLNQMPDVKNRLTRSRTKLVNEVEVEIEKGSLDMVLDSHKECGPKLGKKVNRTRKQKVGHSKQMLDVENCSTQSRTRLANEVEVEIEKGSPDMVLVSLRGKRSRVAKPKVGPSNQMADVENQHEHDWEYNSVKKTNWLTKRKSTNEADRVGNTNALPNDTVLDPRYHHLHQNVILEKYCDKEFEIQPGKQNIEASNQTADAKKKRKVDESSSSLKKTKCLGKRKVTFEVDKVYDNKDGLNSMVLDSRKKGDSEMRRKLNRAMKQKVGPSNQMADVEKNQKYDQPSCSLRKTKGPTKRKAKLPNQQNIRPSNQMPSVQNKHKGEQKHNSLKKKKDEVKVENMKDSPTDLLSYPEHFILYDNLAWYPEFINLEEDDSYMHMGNTVANDEKNSVANDVKKEHEDDNNSEVEILDGKAIMEGEILSSFVPSKRIHNSMDECTASEDEFRKQVMDVLKKPFDKEEYKRHQDAAKCYLDHHQDLKRTLKKYRWKQGKRLTIFRGFFFWLQNLTQEGSFKPWTDRECLAVELGHL